MEMRETSVLARDIAVQVQRFSERIAELRAIAAPDEPSDAGPSRELLARRVHLQDAELTLALEELRAQNDALVAAQASLERERARYADFFDHAHEAYVATDARGIVHEANFAAAELLGLPRPAMVGKLLIAFVARRDTRAFRKILADLRDEQRQGMFCLQIRPRGRAPVPMSVRVRRATRPRKEDVELSWMLRPEEPAVSERSGLRSSADG